MLVLAIAPASSYISSLRALFLPQKALAHEEAAALDIESLSNMHCTALQCTHTNFLKRFQPVVWLKNSVHQEPKSALQLLGTTVGKEVLLANPKTGRKATIKTKTFIRRPSWADNGFSALEEGLF